MTPNKIVIHVFAFGLAVCLSAPATAQTPVAPAPRIAADSTKPLPTPAFTGFQITVSMLRTDDGKLTFGYPHILSIAPDSPALQAGMEVGDAIIEANGSDLIKSPYALFPEAGKKLLLRIRRGETEKEVVLTPLPGRGST